MSSMQAGGGNSVSTYLGDGFTPNPMYDMVVGLADILGESTQIDEIYAFIAQNEDMPEQVLVSLVLDKFGSDLDDILDFVEGCPETPGVLPSHPPPSNLYTRVENVKILDIGSGNCNKVAKCQSRDKVVSDIIGQENNVHLGTVMQLDASSVDDVERESQGRLITSFNVLTQLEKVDHLRDKNGLHICVDIDYLKDIGAVKIGHNKFKMGSYEDYDHDLGGDKIIAGYKGICYYEANKYSYDIVEGQKFKPFNLQINSLSYPLLDNCTVKYDGTCMMFISNEYGTLLKMRNGCGVKLSGPNIESVIYLEKLPKSGPAEVFVLLRVFRYLQYHPFHGTNNLMEFAEKIKLKIGGVPVVGPGYSDEVPLCLKKYPTDGKIYRIGELDYRYKVYATFDINDKERITKYLEDKGICCCFADDYTGMCEYGYEVKDDTVFFKFICNRYDKTVPTSVEAIYSQISIDI